VSCANEALHLDMERLVLLSFALAKNEQGVGVDAMSGITFIRRLGAPKKAQRRSLPTSPMG